MSLEKDFNLGFNRTINLYLGVPLLLPDSFQKTHWILRTLWKLWSYSGVVLICIQCVCLLIQVGIQYDDLTIVMTSGGCCIFIFQVPLKLFLFHINKDLFENVEKEIAEVSLKLHENPLKDKGYAQLYGKYYGFIKTVAPTKLILELVTCTLLIVFFFILGLAYGTRKMAAVIYTPFEKDNNLGFGAATVFELFAVIIAIARNSAIDFLFFTMIIMPSVQLKYMKNLVENTILQDELADLRDPIIWWTKLHQQILRTVGHMKELSSPYLSVIYFTLMLDWLIVVVLCVSQDSSWDTIQKGTLIVVVGSNVFQLYVISAIGDYLQDNSTVVADGFFNTTLSQKDRDLRKILVFVLTRAKKPMLLQAFGILPLSSNSFGQLLRLTFSFILAIVQVQQRNAQGKSHLEAHVEDIN